jgi:hypothetical protein
LSTYFLNDPRIIGRSRGMKNTHNSYNLRRNGIGISLQIQQKIFKSQFNKNKKNKVASANYAIESNPIGFPPPKGQS